MEKRTIRHIALNIALLQMLCNSPITLAKSDSTIIQIQDDIFDIYKRKDIDTGELSPISIFDYENISSHQYGANQTDFKENFEALIQDPYIFEEMQKYYPINSFENEEDAMFFYKKYFEIVADCGCGYASAANFVFRLFEGREEDFYNTFGYPIYKVKKNKEIDFNYEVFMLKFFNYSILEKEKQKGLIDKTIKKSFYEHKVEYYTNELKEKSIIDRKTVAGWSLEEWDAFSKMQKDYKKLINEYHTKYLNEEKFDYNFGIATNNRFGYLSSYLSQFGIRITSSVKNGLGKPSSDEVVASDGFTLYKTDESRNVYNKEKVDLHYVYITDIDEDGIIIVSSWGNMYIFDNKGAKNTQKVILKLTK